MKVTPLVTHTCTLPMNFLFNYFSKNVATEPLEESNNTGATSAAASLLLLRQDNKATSEQARLALLNSRFTSPFNTGDTDNTASVQPSGGPVPAPVLNLDAPPSTSSIVKLSPLRYLVSHAVVCVNLYAHNSHVTIS